MSFLQQAAELPARLNSASNNLHQSGGWGWDWMIEMTMMMAGSLYAAQVRRKNNDSERFPKQLLLLMKPFAMSAWLKQQLKVAWMTVSAHILLSNGLQTLSHKQTLTSNLTGLNRCLIFYISFIHQHPQCTLLTQHFGYFLCSLLILPGLLS